jgi:hypothetical protein
MINQMRFRYNYLQDQYSIAVDMPASIQKKMLDMASIPVAKGVFV